MEKLKNFAESPPDTPQTPEDPPQEIPRKTSVWLTPWPILLTLGLIISVIPVSGRYNPSFIDIGLSILFNGFPVLLWAAITFKSRSPAFLILSALPLFLFNLDSFIEMYLAPRSGGATGHMIATALFPIISTVIALPVSLAIGGAGYLVETLVRERATTPETRLRLRYAFMALVVTAVLLSPLMITSMMKRANVSERIGLPRRVNNDGHFKKTPSPLNGSRLAVGDYDGDGIDEVAELSGNGITLRNTADLSQKAFIPAAVTDYAYIPVIMRQGGGLFLFKRNDCSLYELNGRQVWKFGHGDTTSYVDSLAADLDKDGETEFYCPAPSGLYRLDAEGKKVWKAGGEPGNLFLLPDAPPGEASILTQELGDFRLWTSDGKPAGQFKTPMNNFLPSLLRWSTGYCIADGTPSYEGPGTYLSDFNGKMVLQVMVNKDLGYKEAFSVKFDPDKPPYLVVRSGVGRQVHQSGIDIFTQEGKKVYSEILPDSYNIVAVPDYKNGHGYFFYNGYKYERDAPEAANDCRMTGEGAPDKRLLTEADASFRNRDFAKAAEQYETYTRTCLTGTWPPDIVIKTLDAYNSISETGTPPAGGLGTMEERQKRFRRDAAPEIGIALKTGDTETRKHAAIAAGLLGAEALPAVPALGAALRDLSDDVREQAAAALGRLGTTGSAAQPDLGECCSERGFPQCCMAWGKISEAVSAQGAHSPVSMIPPSAER